MDDNSNKIVETLHNEVLLIDTYKIFLEYKNKIMKALDFEDSISLIELAKTQTQDLIESKLLNSLINKQRYQISMDLDKFILYLDIIDIIYYRNDAQKILDDIKDNITNISQINTLKKIINKKPARVTDSLVCNVTEMKLCPHCFKKN